MQARGFSHVGLSTLDLDATRAFYEDILGFAAVRCDIIEFAEGGRIRHVFYDTGGGALLAFMEPRDIPKFPPSYDAGINRGLGVPDFFYHFAFEVDSMDALLAKRAHLIAAGVKVTPVVDHEWMQSIYFKDPNGIMLEYAWTNRVPRDADDTVMRVRERVSLRQRSPVTDFRSE